MNNQFRFQVLEAFNTETSHYKKIGFNRTYKKLLELSGSHDLSISIMMKEIKINPLELKYNFTKYLYEKRRYRQKKLIASNNR